MPKADHVPYPIDPAERAAYWKARHSSIIPPGEKPFPMMHKRMVDVGVPSRTNGDFLKRVREFCQIPDAVEFRITCEGERADDPPDCYFTCYEMFSVRCRLWFPIPEIIIRILDHFEIGISQLHPNSYLHLVSIVILSYEYGLTLTTDHFEALFRLQKVEKPYIFWLTLRKHMTVIKGLISNCNMWRKIFFFVRINAASVEEKRIPMFRSKPNRDPFISPIHPFPADVIEMRDLMWNGPFYWNFFTPKRVRKAVRRVHPELDMGAADVESDPEDPIPSDVPAEWMSTRSSKGKGIDLGDIEFSADDFFLPGWDPDLAFGDGSGSSEVPIPDFDEFFDGLPSNFNPPPSVDGLDRSAVVAERSRIINGVSRFCL